MALGVMIWYSQTDRSLIKLMLYGKKEDLFDVKAGRPLFGQSLFGVYNKEDNSKKYSRQDQ